MLETEQNIKKITEYFFAGYFHPQVTALPIIETGDGTYLNAENWRIYPKACNARWTDEESLSTINTGISINTKVGSPSTRIHSMAVFMSNKIEAKSLVDSVTERLEEAIIGGQLVPGERLREQVLATEYGISRGPLREAIRRLEGRRLLERKANIGVSVVEISARRMEELLRVREALEGMACRLAAEQIDAKEVKQLRKLLEDHSNMDEVVSGEGYYQQSGDFDFHFRIAKASNNDFLISMITGDLYDLLRVYRYKSSKMAGRAQKALTEHHLIVDALEAKDPDLAEAAMRNHLISAREHALLALWESEKESA